MAIRGIVINPVNRQLLLSRGHKSEVRLHDINSWSVNSATFGEAILTHPKERRFNCFDREQSLSESMSGFPRAHVNVEEEFIGKGYGTALYSACCIAGLYEKTNTKLENTGISSSPYYRSEEAHIWWEKAVKRNVAENVTKSIKFCKEGYSYSLPEKLKKELYKHIIEEDGQIESINEVTINYKAVPDYQEEFRYQILRTTSAISAGWIGLYTTKLNPSILENLNQTNTVLCNLYTFTNANWNTVNPETKSILFNLIFNLAQLTYPERDLIAFEKAVFGRH